MKTNFKSLFIVVARDGNPHLSTLSYLKKDSIKAFLIGSREEWGVWQKAGWKCVKVDVDFKPYGL